MIVKDLETIWYMHWKYTAATVIMITGEANYYW